MSAETTNNNYTTIAIVFSLIVGAVLFLGMYRFNEKAARLEERCKNLEQTVEKLNTLMKERLGNLDKSLGKDVKYLEKSSDKDTKHLREVMNLKLGSLYSQMTIERFKSIR